MSEKTFIPWCDSTLNPWWGCDKVSPGCKYCYITTTPVFRFKGMKHGDPRVKSKGFLEEALALNRKPWICDVCGDAWAEDSFFCGCQPPGSRNKHRRRIFLLSLGDVWDEKVPIEWLAETLHTIWECDQCIWYLCSKRWAQWRDRLTQIIPTPDWEFNDWLGKWIHGYPPPNVLGLCSVEDQQRADERIPQFLKVPLACRGLSLEPLLGPVDLRCVAAASVSGGKFGVDYLSPNHQHVDWLIIGGESGGEARPCDVGWIRSLKEQGVAAGVATFVKQLGAMPVTDESTPDGWPVGTELTWYPCANGGAGQTVVNLKDKKGGDPAEWPQDLNVRQWPEGF